MRALVFIAISIALTAWLPWRPERGDPAHRSPDSASARDGLGCRPPHLAKRTFVGFRDRERWMTDFDAAALEATRILRATRAQSCGLTAQQDASGSLLAALSQRPMEITAIYFDGDDLSSANVQMRRGPETAPAVDPTAPEPLWSLKVVRDDAGWQVTSSSRSYSPLPQLTRLPPKQHSL